MGDGLIGSGGKRWPVGYSLAGKHSDQVTDIVLLDADGAALALKLLEGVNFSLEQVDHLHFTSPGAHLIFGPHRLCGDLGDNPFGHVTQATLKDGKRHLSTGPTLNGGGGRLTDCLSLDCRYRNRCT